MTNKSPVLGKRYKHKDSGFIYWCIPCKIEFEPEQKYQMICESHPHLNMRFSTDCVLDFFEPILDQLEDLVNETALLMNGSHKDNLEQKDNSNQSEVEEVKGCSERENKYFKAGWIGARDMFRPSKEVEKAKEKLRALLGLYTCWEQAAEYCPELLYDTAQNLLNALDAQKESNNHQISKDAPVKACNDSGCDDNDKLSNKESIYSGVSELRELFKHIHDQNFSPELITYLEIILDHQEQNTKRLDKLELLIKEK